MAQSLGMVRLVGVYNHYLQANNGGVMHCSNSEWHTEETFFLIKFGNGIYTLVNYASSAVLQRHGGGTGNHRITCEAGDLSGPENRNFWRLIPGDLHGAPGLVAFQSPYDNSFMTTLPVGNNAPGEGGEVAADFEALGANNPDWHGWWRMEAVTEQPTPGGGFWKTIGGVGMSLVSIVVQQVLQDLIASAAG